MLNDAPTDHTSLRENASAVEREMRSAVHNHDRRIILLLGSPRSGTTWLAKTLDSYPGALYQHEPLARRLNPDINRLVETFKRGDSVGEQQRYQFLDGLIRTHTHGDRPPFFAKDFRRCPARLAWFAWSVVRSTGLGEPIFRRLTTPPADAVFDLLIKEVGWETWAANIVRCLLPDLLLIIRHPCAVVASRLRGARLGLMAIQDRLGWYHAQRQFSEKLGYDEQGIRRLSDAEFLTLEWLRQNILYEQARSLCAKSHVVVYEDLCRQPDRVIRDIFRFLGWTFGPETRAFLDASTRDDPYGRALHWKRPYYAIVRDPRGASSGWKSELSAEDQAKVAAIARNFSGYDAYWPTEKKASGPFSMPGRVTRSGAIQRPAIQVENLSKCYVIGPNAARGYRTLRESLVEFPKAVSSRLRSQLTNSAFQDARPTKNTGERNFWALNDVSFEIQPGDVVGIVGRNGAGKSTLLKILSRITEPTIGRVSLRGRVASLLEVGTGFHPELSGRENILLNASLLGMSRHEILRRFDEIVSFAEVEAFVDLPIKRYSSGMSVRLAFAIAAHLQPEILILDEVLAVGDARFQKKCLEKVDLVKNSGTTILLVSHQMQVIQAITKRSILLERGEIRKIGKTAEVVAAYLAAAHDRARDNVVPIASSDTVALVDIQILSQETEFPTEIIRGEPLRIDFSLIAEAELSECDVSIAVRNAEGVELFSHSWTDHHRSALTVRKGRNTLTLNIPTAHFRPGCYWLTFCLSRYESEVLLDVRGINLPSIALEPTANLSLESRRWGVVFIGCNWAHHT